MRANLAASFNGQRILALCILFTLGNVGFFFIRSAEVIHINKAAKTSLPPVIRLSHSFVSTTPFRPNIPRRPHAVCIGGYRDTLLKKNMSKTLITNVLIPNDADLFVYVTVDDLSTFPIEEFQRLYEPWLKSFVIIEESAIKEEVASFRVAQDGNTVLGLVPTQIFLKMHKCYDTLVAPYELARGMVDYDRIFYTRPDMYYDGIFHMSNYTDPSVIYSPPPYNINEYVEFAKTDPKNDGLLVWPGGILGINDQCFLASSRIFRLVSHALWMLYPSIREMVSIHNSFAEHQLWWVVRERLKITVKCIPDLVTTICHDGRNCYKMRGKEIVLE